MKKFKNSHLPSFIIILLVTAYLMSPIINIKVSIGHDYGFHETNMISTIHYLDFLKLKLLPPKIFGLVARGFGYGAGIFYPPLTYIVTAYFGKIATFLKINYQYGITLLQTFALILSSINMYLFVNRISKNKCVSLISAISYISAPYLLNDIYVRTAIGETLAFIFYPLIFWSIYELLSNNKKKFYYLFIIGYTGLILSHLILTIYITIIVLIILLMNFKKAFTKKNIKLLFIATIIVFLLTSPYWVPILEHYFCGNYYVFYKESMYSIDQIKSNAIYYSDLFRIKNKTLDGVKIYLNHLTFFLLVISIVFRKKIFSKKENTITSTIITLLLIVTFLSTKYFPWKILPDFLKNIQFPWRLCSFIIFGISVISGFSIRLLSPKKMVIFTIILIILIMQTGYLSITRKRIYMPISFDYNMGLQNEYLPVNTIKNYDYFETRENDIISIKGEATVENLIDNGIIYEGNILLLSDEAIIELPRIYYLGYNITLKDSLKKIENIKYYENERGFIEIKIKHSGILKIKYEKTICNKIADILCILTILYIGIIIILKKKNINIM